MATGPHVAMIPMMEISDEFQPEGRFASPSANIPLRQRFWRKDRINGDRLGRPESALGGERRHHSMRHAGADVEESRRRVRKCVKTRGYGTTPVMALFQRARQRQFQSLISEDIATAKKAKYRAGGI